MPLLSPVEISIPAIDSVPETSWLESQWLKYTVITIGLIVTNLYVLSLTAALISVMLVGLMAYPFIKEYFSSAPPSAPDPIPDQNVSSPTPTVSAVPIVMAVSKQRTHTQEPIDRVQPSPPISLTGYRLNGLFATNVVDQPDLTPVSALAMAH